jgi:putative SOS response-associated peptidase YedK
VILEAGAWESWLTGEPTDALDVLKAAPETRLTYYPVPKAVGSPKNDTPNLVDPA